MTIEAKIETRLSALAGGRIYAVTPPKNIALPCVVYVIVSRARMYSHSGVSKLNRYRVQMSCYAEGYAAAKDLADSVTVSMESWSAADTNIQGIFHENEEDIYEKDTGLYHVPVDFMIWYQE